MIDAVRQIVETHLKDNWTQTPISFENVYFEQQDGQPFIEVIIMPDTGNQASLGEKALNRWTGSIIISVYVPLGQGSSAAFRLADDITQLFYRFTEDGFTAWTAHTVPSEELGQWYKVDVNIPYQYDAIL